MVKDKIQLKETVTVEMGGDELDFDVEAVYYKGENFPVHRFTPSPPDPPEIYDIEIKLNGVDISLFVADEVFKKVEDKLWEML